MSSQFKCLGLILCAEVNIGNSCGIVTYVHEFCSLMNLSLLKPAAVAMGVV